MDAQAAKAVMLRHDIPEQHQKLGIFNVRWVLRNIPLPHQDQMTLKAWLREQQSALKLEARG